MRIECREGGPYLLIREQRERMASAQKLYGSAFNPEITLKALSYFDDGDLRTLPEDMKIRLVTAAGDVDLERLPDVDQALRRGAAEQEYGR